VARFPGGVRDGSLCDVDAWIWGAVVLAIVLVIAGGISWWLARGCMLTIVGATGAIIGGVMSLIALVVLLDPDAGQRAAAIITVGSGAWLLAWALAGGIRGQRLLRAEERAAAEAATVPGSAGVVGGHARTR
jgi:hypothetical protein